MYEKFQALMDERGMTPYRVSKETGISQSTLSDWKNGRITPKMDKIETLAKFFNVSMDYFVLGDFNDKLTPEQKEQDEIMTMISKIKPDKYAEIKRFLKYKMLEDDL